MGFKGKKVVMRAWHAMIGQPTTTPDRIYTYSIRMDAFGLLTYFVCSKCLCQSQPWPLFTKV